MTSSPKKFILGVAALLALAAGAAAVKKTLTPPKVSYITASATRMDLEESVLATGVLKAYKTVAVGAQVNGQLKTLHVALGDTVKKGQLLAEIDPVLARNTLADAEAQVKNLKAQRRSKQVLLNQYELACKRQSRITSVDAGSQADLESAQALLESTRYDIAALAAQIDQAVIAVDTARANFGYTRIHAPISGTVISIDTEEGQTVVSNQSATTILTLATLDTMTVKTKISEADVMKITPGLPAYFTLLGDSDKRYYGKLRAIEPGPVSGSATTTGTTNSSSTAVYYYGLFEVANPDHALKVSMTAQVAIVLNHVKQGLCIPVSAIGDKQADGRATVRILTGDRVETRSLRTGVSNNVEIEVIGGLKEGEKIIIGDSSSLPRTDSENMPQPPGRR
jgi:macrolide-specific efflux system membrane fusion protein